MRTQKIANTPYEVSRLAFGCMAIGGSWGPEPITESTRKQAILSIRTALDEGINFFDHADIYGRGKSEEAFSGIWQEVPNLRDKIIVQSKVGIRFPDDEGPHRFDFSYGHIIRTVEGSLKRLGTDYLDLLLLHRPDPLVEPEEVARAFDALQQAGKVRHFGVSNHTGTQIDLLKKCVRQPLVINQLEISVLHLPLIEAGIITNQTFPSHAVRGEGTLEYCRLHDITVQAWSPLARGKVTGAPYEGKDAAEKSRIEKVSALVLTMAEEKAVSREAIIVAWLLRHPAHIQPIIGTTRPDRIRAACQGDEIDLSREEWYALFTAGRGAPLP